MQVRFLSRNIEVVSCPSPNAPFFDGSQDWVIAQNDVVAGSSPASGSRCRGSSVVEHVNPSSILIRRFFDGPKTSGYLSLVRIQSAPPDGAVAQSVEQSPRRPLPIPSSAGRRTGEHERPRCERPDWANNFPNMIGDSYLIYTTQSDGSYKLAHSVEHLSMKQTVAGSNPALTPKYFQPLAWWFFSMV